MRKTVLQRVVRPVCSAEACDGSRCLTEIAVHLLSRNGVRLMQIDLSYINRLSPAGDGAMRALCSRLLVFCDCPNSDFGGNKMAKSAKPYSAKEQPCVQQCC